MLCHLKSLRFRSRGGGISQPVPGSANGWPNAMAHDRSCFEQGGGMGEGARCGRKRRLSSSCRAPSTRNQIRE
eukprot:319857-Chlamydomonas_euryale.AAC.4